MQSDFDWNFVGFRRAVDSVFNNRDSRSGKLIKPHDVEDQRSTLVEDTYFNQTLLSVSLNASKSDKWNIVEPIVIKKRSSKGKQN
jgi:hypothetical protein